ncbi:DUF1772 domain-containing protein [Starkeya sp. ORNL1]|uniref:anthrone oxygenase family protein n=1 Tax=Starkeya sp. ORNL1 TaxID=2709380 RepID=UPI0014646AC5|nr:anthrone oxygenase family protein [Starkeya sp. ORNL1]QJP16632.1 DUF1772 domain-containing protein [Starkeya sp. ORNL1]
MYVAFEILTVLIVACAMAPALAHVLELPGKMRLDEPRYRTVQTIYHPGFTIAGAAEPAGIIATFLLVLATPLGSTRFWLILLALAALTFMQLIFWLVTQPVNRHWLRETQLSGSAKRFFGTESHDAAGAAEPHWKELRSRWERSHLMRAAAAMLALIVLTTAVAL